MSIYRTSELQAESRRLHEQCERENLPDHAAAVRRLEMVGECLELDEVVSLAHRRRLLHGTCHCQQSASSQIG